jgi:hypothetical protein
MWWKGSSISRVSFAKDSVLQVMEDSLFSGFTSLEYIKLPSSVEIIGDTCFKDCVSLSSVVLESGLKRVGSSVFCGCKNLKEIKIPSSVESLSDSWWNGSFISRLSFGSASVLQRIDDNAFSGLIAWKSLKFHQILKPCLVSGGRVL